MAAPAARMITDAGISVRHKDRLLSGLLLAANLEVRVFSNGSPVADGELLFKVTSEIEASFPDGAQSVVKTNSNGEAKAPPLTAGTRIGTVTVTVSAPDHDTTPYAFRLKIE